MAAGPFIAYPSFILHTVKQEFDYENDTVKAALLKATYTPSLAHDAWDDVSAHECDSADYDAITLTGKTVALNGSNKTVYDANNLDYGNAASIAARYLVIYKDSGVPATSYLMGYCDLNDGGTGDLESTASDFDISFNVAGIYDITPNL